MSDTSLRVGIAALVIAIFTLLAVAGAFVFAWFEIRKQIDDNNDKEETPSVRVLEDVAAESPVSSIKTVSGYTVHLDDFHMLAAVQVADVNSGFYCPAVGTKRDMNVVDAVGGNGLFAAHISDRSRSVIVLEADSDVFESTRSFLLPYAHVECVRAVLGETHGEVHVLSNGSTVNTVRLDVVLQDFSHVDMVRVKGDSVSDGMIASVYDKVDAWLVDFAAETVSVRNTVREMFYRCGYLFVHDYSATTFLCKKVQLPFVAFSISSLPATSFAAHHAGRAFIVVGSRDIDDAIRFEGVPLSDLLVAAKFGLYLSFDYRVVVAVQPTVVFKAPCPGLVEQEYPVGAFICADGQVSNAIVSISSTSLWRDYFRMMASSMGAQLALESLFQSAPGQAFLGAIGTCLDE
jgi:hypothetical protein